MTGLALAAGLALGCGGTDNGGGSGQGGSGTGAGGTTTGGGGATGAGGARAGGGGAGLAGASGGMGGSGVGGTTGGGGSTGATCSSTTPPAGSTLIGWAATNPLNAAGTTGGGAATPVMVTTTSAFNTNAGGTAARVLYVMGSLTGNFTIGSNKTIVGLCGASLHGHVEISNSTNVILRNLTVVGYGAGNCALDPTYDATVGCSSGYDAITVIGAQRVWIDHCDISDGTDGNLDITLGSNFVTVSWTKFHYTKRTDNTGNDSTGASGHRFSNLVGGADNSPVDVNALNVTWHHDWWADNVSERQPRVRYGKNHIFNNLFTGAGDDYCVRAGMNAQLLLENNVFTGVASPHQFNSTADQATASITANNDLYSATTGSRSTGGGGTAFAAAPYSYILDDTAALEAAIQAGAGPQ